MSAYIHYTEEQKRRANAVDLEEFLRRIEQLRQVFLCLDNAAASQRIAEQIQSQCETGCSRLKRKRGKSSAGYL